MSIKKLELPSDDSDARVSDVVQAYLDLRGWYSSSHQRVEDEDEVIFMLEFAAENVASIPVKVVARDKAHQILFIAACPFIVPDSRKIEVIGRIIDMNTSIAVGAFVLAADEKILTFRTGIDFINAGTDIHKNLLDCQTKLVFETLDEALPGLTELFFAGGEPVQTLEDYFAAKRNLQ